MILASDLVEEFEADVSTRNYSRDGLSFELRVIQDSDAQRGGCTSTSRAFLVERRSKIVSECDALNVRRET